MELVVYNIKGEKTAKTVTLNESIFEVTPNDHAIYLDTKQYLANQRQGTHASLEKSMVSGSTKKLKKQKGTGGARAGSRKSPLFRGGARAFGPQPRDYSFKLNKKLKKLARLSALAYKVKENNIMVVEDFNFESPKTSSYAAVLSALKLDGRKTLLVTARKYSEHCAFIAQSEKSKSNPCLRSEYIRYSQCSKPDTSCEFS